MNLDWVGRVARADADDVRRVAPAVSEQPDFPPRCFRVIGFQQSHWSDNSVVGVCRVEHASLAIHALEFLCAGEPCPETIYPVADPLPCLLRCPDCLDPADAFPHVADMAAVQDVLDCRNPVRLEHPVGRHPLPHHSVDDDPFDLAQIHHRTLPEPTLSLTGVLPACPYEARQGARKPDVAREFLIGANILTERGDSPSAFARIA